MLCSGGTHCYSIKGLKPRSKWQQNKRRRRWFGFYNLPSVPDEKLRNLFSCAPSPMAAAEALFSGGTHHHSIKGVAACGERRKIKRKRERFGLYNLFLAPDEELRNLFSCSRSLAHGGGGGALQRRNSSPLNQRGQGQL